MHGLINDVFFIAVVLLGFLGFVRVVDRFMSRFASRRRRLFLGVSRVRESRLDIGPR